MNGSTRPVVIGLGEILWDVFPDGARFGGAPANFACSAAGLAGGAARVSMAGAVGSDDLGRKAVAEFAARGVDVSAVAILREPTGRVDVTVDKAGHASYVFAPDCAWDGLPWSDSLGGLAAGASAVCYGTLGSRGATSRATIRRFLAEVPPPALRILDINLRPPFWNVEVIQESIALANVVKCNDDELPVLAGILGLSGGPEAILRQLVDRHALRLAALTRGANGSLLVAADGATSDLPGTPIDVVDTVGAGDAFTAAATLGLLAGWPLERLHAHAERVAAFVCTRAGGTPPIPDDLRIAREGEALVRFACPVCGYRGLQAPPYARMPNSPYPDFGEPPYGDTLGEPCHGGCHGCGYEFGYDDEADACGTPKSFRTWRQQWMAGGCRWWSSRPQPADWDPPAQLRAAGIDGG